MFMLTLLLMSSLEVKLSSAVLKQGEVLYVSVSTPEQGLLTLTYREKPYPLIPWCDGFVAVIGTSYRTDAGRKPIRVRLSTGSNRGEVVDTAVLIEVQEFRKSFITLPQGKQGTVDTSLARRKQEEYEAVTAAINAPSQGFYALLPVLMPCEEKISGTYGDERWYNGEKGWNHAGVDFAIREGTPILAPCAGQVQMARDTFIRQGTFVLLDHGAGLKTMYYHMSKRLVEDGQTVQAGDTLGLVGSTGMATGPHLHMSVYVNGVPVDPLYWLKLKQPF